MSGLTLFLIALVVLFAYAAGRSGRSQVPMFFPTDGDARYGVSSPQRTEGLLPQNITIHEHEAGILYRNGKLDRVIQAGRYWIWPPYSEATIVDIRERMLQVMGQEVLSADNVALKVSVVVTYRVVDPAKALTSVESFHQSLYTEAQLALRAAVAHHAADSLLENRAVIGEAMTTVVTQAGARLGLEVLRIELKDYMFPGDLKKAFAEVIRARKLSEASLERARGEAATLRSLANAARLIESHPALSTLRVLQAMGESKGNTFVLGVTPGLVPEAPKKDPGGELDTPPDPTEP